MSDLFDEPAEWKAPPAALALFAVGVTATSTVLGTVVVASLVAAASPLSRLRASPQR
jgi:hypothetical protein